MLKRDVISFDGSRGCEKSEDVSGRVRKSQHGSGRDIVGVTFTLDLLESAPCHPCSHSLIPQRAVSVGLHTGLSTGHSHSPIEDYIHIGNGDDAPCAPPQYRGI